MNNSEINLIKTLFLIILLVVSSCTYFAQTDTVPFPEALNSASISVSPSMAMDNQLIIGNGDINGLISVDKKTIVVDLSKNDVGDWRYDSTQDPEIVKISEIRRRGHEGTWSAPTGNWFAGKSTPGPLKAGLLTIKLDRDITENGKDNVLDIQHGVAVINTDSNDKKSHASIRALADRNVFLINVSGHAKLTSPRAKEVVQEGGIRTLFSKLPSNEDWPGMSYAVAMAEAGRVKCVAIVTSFESDDPLADAVRLVSETISQKYSYLVKSHEENWLKFWSASGVNIEDSYLQDVWYRNLYFLRCVSKPGAACVGLYAGVQGESSHWYGAHTLNYNNEQTFFGAFTSNHVELAHSYKDLICDWIPKGKWLAKKAFEAEGTYFPHNLNTFNADPAKSVLKGHSVLLHHPWGYSLCVTGWAVQNVWNIYEYRPDHEYLKTTAYPAVREAALFYASFLEACDKREDGKARFGPVVVPERHGWSKDLSRNYDSTSAIAYARWSLRTAIRAATLLKQDAELIDRFRKALELLPEYPTYGNGLEEVVVSCAGVKPHVLNIPVTSLPVYPADQITFFSPQVQKDLFIRTIETSETEHINDWIMLPMARARLSMPGAVDFMKNEFTSRQRPNGTLSLIAGSNKWNQYGHYTETFAATAAISELLLQSVGGIIRVFPAWPKDKGGAFVNLRAEGGFLVSAKQADGEVQRLTVKSTVGGELEIYSPWANISVQRGGGQTEKLKTDDRGVVILNTRKDEELMFISH